MERTILRAVLLTALLFTTGLRIRAQDGAVDTAHPWHYAWEIGAGPAPIPQALGRVSLDYGRMVEMGQYPNAVFDVDPAFILSWVYILNKKWDIAVSGGLSWFNYRLFQYETFGTDPEGKPRYDRSTGHYTGYWGKSLYCGALSVTGRRTWLRKGVFDLYSGIGLGISGGLYADGWVLPMLALTPVGFRLGGRHLYVFAEATISPTATLGQGGLGWRF